MTENKKRINGRDLPCQVIEDLFPSYVEELTGDITNELVKEHVSTCPDCKSKLDKMQTTFAEEDPQELKIGDGGKSKTADTGKEIDFLKKVRKNNRKWILIWAAVIWLAAVLFVGVRFFLIGSYMNTEYLAYNLEVNGDQIHITGQATSDAGIQYVEFNESQGVVEITVRGVEKSLFYKGHFDRSFQSSEPVRQIWIGDRIIWADGNSISPVTSNVYAAYNYYVGNMPGNGKVATALNMVGYLGNFTNELQTSKEPYEWKMILERDFSGERQEELEKRMQSYAYVLLAEIGNLGQVTYDYHVDGQAMQMTVTTEDASAFVGTDIKEVGQDIVLLEALMQKSGLADHVVSGGMPSTNNQVDYSQSSQVDKLLAIDVVNFAEDEIYGLSISVEDGKNNRGAQSMTNADGSSLEDGAIINFQLIPEDFPQEFSSSEGKIKVTVYDKDGNPHEAQGDITIDLIWGTQYRINLSGNTGDGYQLGK